MSRRAALALLALACAHVGAGAVTIVYRGPAFYSTPGTADVYEVKLVNAEGRTFLLSGMTAALWTLPDCDACPDTPVTDEAPTDSILLTPGRLSGLSRPIPEHIVTRACPAGGACLARVPVPPGRYRLVVTGVFSCPPREISIPLHEQAEVVCAQATRFATPP
jgi:hypothetical protein